MGGYMEVTVILIPTRSFCWCPPNKSSLPRSLIATHWSSLSGANCALSQREPSHTDIYTHRHTQQYLFYSIPKRPANKLCLCKTRAFAIFRSWLSILIHNDLKRSPPGESNPDISRSAVIAIIFRQFLRCGLDVFVSVVVGAFILQQSLCLCVFVCWCFWRTWEGVCV